MTLSVGGDCADSRGQEAHGRSGTSMLARNQTNNLTLSNNESEFAVSVLLVVNKKHFSRNVN